ncbi:MAG: alanine racemase [Victivallaceae bacterium]|nr:alanine racemase [Victivallaceae bacterium]
MLKRTWLEIDTGIIRENFAAYRRNLDASMQIMAVVKADAYGHGATATAGALQKSGCRLFAVATLTEAIELREAGIGGEILILGYTPAAEKENLLRYDVTQTLLSAEHARAMRGIRFKAQFAIDTGMNRIGLDGDDPGYCEKVIREYAPDFQLTGLFTHLCVADTPEENDVTRGQLEHRRRAAERCLSSTV